MSDQPLTATDATAGAVVPIRPWIDPVVDEHGYDPRSRYVEMFWLGVLGPSNIMPGANLDPCVSASTPESR